MFFDELVLLDCGLGMQPNGRSSMQQAQRSASSGYSQNNGVITRTRRDLARGYDLMMGEMDDGDEWKNVDLHDDAGP